MVSGYSGLSELLDVCIKLQLIENIDERDSLGNTALIWVAKNGHSHVASLLLEVGADPDMTNHSSQSALFWAAAHGNLVITRLLVNKGCFTTMSDEAGWTPLHWATQNSHPEIVKCLLVAGATTEVRDASSWTPLQRAKHRHVQGYVHRKWGRMEKKLIY